MRLQGLGLVAVTLAGAPALTVSSFFKPDADGCKNDDGIGCAAAYEAIARLESGQPLNTVAGISSGTLDCSQLFDHKDKWVIDLSAKEEISATRKSFRKGVESFVTWCGTIDGEPDGSVCMTWKEGDLCSAQNFYLVAVRSADGPFNRVFESQPGTGRRRRLADGTTEVVDDQMAVIQVYKQYNDEEPPEPEGTTEEVGKEGARRLRYRANPDLQGLDHDVAEFLRVKMAGEGSEEHEEYLSRGGQFVKEGGYGEADSEGGVSYVVAPSGRRLDTGVNIDVMVVYSPLAASMSGGESALRAKITTGVATFNDVLAGSTIAATVTLVYMGSVVFTETDYVSDLTKLRNGLTLTAGGTTSTKRAEVGADLVQLVIHNPMYCGYGAVMQPSSDASWGVANGFSLTHQSCFDQYSNVHEWGHNMGASHDYPKSTSAFGYGYGYLHCVSGGYRTVMAYSCSSGTSVNRAPYFSSPLIYYGGMTTGTTGADNVRVIKQTIGTVCNFMPSVTKTTTPVPAPAPVVVVAPAPSTPAVVAPPPPAPSTPVTPVLPAAPFWATSGKASTFSMAYMGCYKDSTTTRDLLGPSKSMSGAMTPLRCGQYCNLKGYTVAGMQSGGQCYCDNSYGTYGKLTDSYCTVPCDGDSAKSCGGVGNNAVWALKGSADSYTYFGCYKDSSSSHALSGGVVTFTTTNSPSACASACAKFNYFGLQNGNQCYCGNGSVTKYGASTSCTTPCTGDSTKRCGGYLSNTVYVQDHNGALTYRGCYKDKRLDRDLSGTQQSFSLKNSPAKCYTYCKKMGYKTFGLQDGFVCFCDNDYGKFGSAGETQCDTSCPGDNTAICGGLLANSVYSINF